MELSSKTILSILPVHDHGCEAPEGQRISSRSARPNHVLTHVVTLGVPRRFEFVGAAIVTVNKTGMTSNQPRD